MGNSSSRRNRSAFDNFNYRPDLDHRQYHFHTLPYGKEWKIAKDLPPSYDAATAESSPRSSSSSHDGAEDALETLRRYDTVVVVDDSGSMRTQWEQTRSALAVLVDMARKYDANGVDIHFLNSNEHGLNMTDSNAVMSLFNKVQPNGPTPLGRKLRKLLNDYINDLERSDLASASSRPMKPVNFLVITDGAPTDDRMTNDTTHVIVQAARRLDNSNQPLCQVGIQFVQIGRNRDAKQYLESLDNNLAGKYRIRDIVDTTPYNRYNGFDAELLTKVLLGGINRRVDKLGGAGVLHC